MRLRCRVPSNSVYVSRSNRSYIVGNLHGEHEINLAVPYINDAKQRCKQFFLELTNWEGEEEDRNEKNWLQLGYFLTEEHRQYKISHPLTRIPIEQFKREY